MVNDGGYTESFFEIEATTSDDFVHLSSVSMHIRKICTMRNLDGRICDAYMRKNAYAKKSNKVRVVFRVIQIHCQGKTYRKIGYPNEVTTLQMYIYLYYKKTIKITTFVFKIFVETLALPTTISI